MKNSDEMTNSILSRRDRYFEEKAKKKKVYTKIIAGVSGACLVAAITIGIFSSGLFMSVPGTASNIGDYTLPPGENVPENIDDGTGAGGYYEQNGVLIPILPENNRITYNGEVITDDEVKEFLDTDAVASTLRASGIPADDIRISEKGYCHVSYGGPAGSSLVINRNFRDYPVYNGDDLVSVITMTKEGGVLHDNTSFGGSYFESFNDYLKDHRGQAVLFLYAGNVEIAISPDGTWVSTAGLDVSMYLTGINEPYKWFYDESAVYTP